VIASNIILNGIVKGDIEAADRVELGPKARVLGNVYYTTIETAVGAQINGKLIHRANSGAVTGAGTSAGEAGPEEQ
jgi:cytoskeletal protein CcmA (bactofilin family)